MIYVALPVIALLIAALWVTGWLTFDNQRVIEHDEVQERADEGNE